MSEPDPDAAFVAQSHINGDCVDDCPWCAKRKREKSRWNPYEDWGEVPPDNQNACYTVFDMHQAKRQAWNEGAQIAGGRDA